MPQHQINYIFQSFLVCLLAVTISAQTISYYQTGEEFNGPFPSWKNVKTDYGAKGDGVTDDAAAINTAINAMKNTNTNNYCVLYFPAGTYKINSTIANIRILGDDYSGMGIIGEDPATTIISWGGSSGGVMFKLDGWSIKVSRLTFDGKSSAASGILRDGQFGTGCEMSDLVFLDFPGTGLPAATRWQDGGLSLSANGNGQAEHLIIRCKFIRCGLGIPAYNMNSLDLWVWYCLFQDCGKGIDRGGFQVYGSVFLRSTTWDICGNAWQPGTFVNNISVGSKDFFTRSEMGPFYLQNNKIYSCAKTYAQPAANSVYANSSVWINNTQSSTAPATVELPETPPKVARKVFEVTSASNIQSQIIAACNEPAGSRPVVHIPKGRYNVSATIIVPGNKDISIIGDGSGGFATSIGVSTAAVTPTIKLLAPSRVTIQDMDFDGNPGILAEVSDEPGSRVRGRLFNAQGYDPTRLANQALVIDSIEHSDLMFSGIGIQRCANGVLVRGGNDLGAGQPTEGQVAFLSGASSHGRGLWNVQNGGKLIGQGFWYEADISSSTHMVELSSTSRGTIALSTMFWCHSPSDNLMVSINNFTGVFSGLADKYTTYSRPVGVKITGSGQNCYAIQGYTYFQEGGTTAQNWIDQSSPDASAAFLGNVSDNGSLPNVWKKTSGAAPDTASLSKLFGPFRNLNIQKEVASPNGATDIKLCRVVATNSGGIAARFMAKPATIPAIHGQNLSSGYRMQTRSSVISMGQAFKIPAGATRILVYTAHGRMVWNKAITNMNDVYQATDKIESLRKQGVLLVRYSYSR